MTYCCPLISDGNLPDYCFPNLKHIIGESLLNFHSMASGLFAGALYLIL